MANTVTIKAVTMPAQRHKDGTYNVKIRVTYKGNSRYIASNITATAADVTRAGTLKHGSAMIAANGLIEKLYKFVSELNYFALRAMSVEDVACYLRRRMETAGGFRLDMFEYVEGLSKHSISPGTRKNYETTMNAVARFIGGRRLDINDVDKAFLLAFDEFVKNEPKANSLGIQKKGNCYMAKFAAIYNRAKNEYNDEDNGIINIPRNPFKRLVLRYSPSMAHKAKTPEFIQQIIDYNGPCSPRQRLALDIYILSFCLMGMNLCDMYTCAPADKDGIITYERSKTKDRRPDRALHKVKIDERIKPLVEKYADPNGERLFNFYLHYPTYNNLNCSMSTSLSVWGKRQGLGAFTLYSARHSWATIARSSRCGIDKALVNECLCHVDTDLKIADVYIERDWQVLFDANKKVLDLFEFTKI